MPTKYLLLAAYIQCRFCRCRFTASGCIFYSFVLLPCERVMPLNISRCFTYRVPRQMRKGPVRPAWLPACLWPQRSCNQEPGDIGWVQIPDRQARAGMWTQMWTIPSVLPAIPLEKGCRVEKGGRAATFSVTKVHKVDLNHQTVLNDFI